MSTSYSFSQHDDRCLYHGAGHDDRIDDDNVQYTGRCCAFTGAAVDGARDSYDSEKHEQFHDDVCRGVLGLRRKLRSSRLEATSLELGNAEVATRRLAP